MSEQTETRWFVVHTAYPHRPVEFPSEEAARDHAKLFPTYMEVLPVPAKPQQN